MSTNSTNTTPLGTLIKLPPEIRHQIYHHVFDKSYIVFWTYYPREDFASPISRGPINSIDLAFRRVSKYISAEASARFFNEVTFSFLIRFEFCDRLSRPLAKKDTEKMMNVEFVVDPGSTLEAWYIELAEFGRGYPESMWGKNRIVPMVTASGEVKGRPTIYDQATMNPRCESSLDHFTGTEVERNHFSIIFRAVEEDFHVFMATRFFQTLKKCIGFRSIKVTLEWFEFDYSVRKTGPAAKKAYEVLMELKPCWGPCTVKDVTDQRPEADGSAGPDDMEKFFAFELVFHPLEFHRRKVKAEGVGVRKEVGPQAEIS